MNPSSYWRTMAKQAGVTDSELWGARLVARFAQDRPDEYNRAVERICRQKGDAVAKMVAYVQRQINRAMKAK